MTYEEAVRIVDRVQPVITPQKKAAMHAAIDEMAERRGVKPWKFLYQIPEDALDEWAAVFMLIYG